MERVPTMRELIESVVTGDGGAPTDPPKFDVNRFKDSILAPENSGKRNYAALNPQSSATGAYQILYTPNKDTLRDQFGINSRQDFASNHKAQESFMNMLVDGYRADAADLQKEYAPQLGKKMLKEHEIMALVHFLGRQRTREYLGYVLRDGRDEASILPEGYANLLPSVYLKKFNDAWNQ